MMGISTGRGNRAARLAKNKSAQAVVWVIASMAISTVVHLGMIRYNMENADKLLQSMCEDRARMLQDQFAVSVNHVHALAILVSTFHLHKNPSAIDQETFAEYTAMTAFERPLFGGVAYAQRVMRSERFKFEEQHGWAIRTIKREPSPEQDEYAPVIFAQETISYLKGLDMMSGEEDRENILRARATGKAVLTCPFRLLESNHLGVVFTFPVYGRHLSQTASVEEREEVTAGYLGGGFDVETLVETLLKQLAGNTEIVVNVYDVTNTSMPLIMYGPEDMVGYSALSHFSMLEFGDPFRKHQMVCRFSQKPPIPWSAIYTPTGVFVIVMLIGYIIFTAYNRYATVVEDCRKMEELKVQAEAADVAKSQFLATVSHEIRTPMHGVLGMLDMLLDTELSSTQKDYAQTAQVCGKALISLINEVLDRAKIEAGKLEIEAVPFDIRSILDDVISLFSAKSGIELAVFVSDKVPEILMGDPGRFRQIITNLVGNSIKFTERGHIFIQVHLAGRGPGAVAAEVSEERDGRAADSFGTLSGLETADGGNGWARFERLLADDEAAAAHGGDDVAVMVSVEDTGIGIPIHAQDRVFTPFMQVDSSTSRHYGGTGIGLSITKCLVELMGGHISFISRPRVGSTFTFTAVFKLCSDNGTDAVPSFRGTRAAVVDGLRVRRAVAAYHLRRLGVEVVEDEGRQVDVVVVEKDSWREGVGQEGVPVVVVGSGGVGVASDSTIGKPLRASTVAAGLEKVVGGRKRGEGPGQGGVLRGVLVGKRILVVDDNSVNRRIAAAALSKHGAVVECANSGKDAITLLRIPHNFDACFMDVQMPEMDGFEATRRIRQMENEAREEGGREWHLPVLAMTADVIQATYEECMKSGMDGYVSKPFEEKQLYQAVAKFFVRSSDSSTSPTSSSSSSSSYD
ncbi:CHASE domain containing histidine kinase protein [Wolffia australiana]